MGGGKGSGLGNHPGAVLVGIIASVIGIVTFITGRHSLSDFLPPGSTEGRINEASYDSAGTNAAVPRDQPDPLSPSTPPAVLDDFESSHFSAWRVTSFGSHTENVRWQPLSDGGRQFLEATGGTEFGGGNSVAYIPTVNMADGVVSGRVKVHSVFNAGHHSGIIARYKDSNNFYEFYSNEPSQGVWLNCWIDGRELHLGSKTLPQEWFRSWIRLKLVLKGAELKAYANDRLVIIANDRSHYSGSAGLVNMGGITWFDDFHITLPGDVGTPNSTPAADG